MSSNNHPAGDPDPPDFNRLLRANLQRVFNERNPIRRAEAIAELYSADPTMYEPDAVIDGREAISAVAGKLLDHSARNSGSRPKPMRSAIMALARCAGMRVRRPHRGW